MRFSHGSLSLSALAASLALVACTSGGGEPKQNAGTAGTSGGAGNGGSTGGAGNGGNGGSTGAAGAAGTSGTAGNGGTTGAAGTTGTAGTTGAAGTGSDGGAGSPHTDGGTTIVDGAPVTTAGCAGHNYPLCLDFEDTIDTTIWSGGNKNAIETTHVAHGTHAYHLYSDNKANPQGGVFYTSKLGTLKDKIYGRFYLHFSPGAPGNHGNLVAASDGVFANGNYNGNWYEIGWQFDGIMGVFHTSSGAERPLRSLPYIVDKWYCIELYFDGSVKGSPQWWIDGAEVKYYTPQAGLCCANSNPTTPESVLIPQFKSITVGWTPYQGLQLLLPDQKQPPTMPDSRVVTDAWMDDVAFDTQRIGCIE